MATAASGTGFVVGERATRPFNSAGLADFVPVNGTLVPDALRSWKDRVRRVAAWQIDPEKLKSALENPYVGVGFVFAALCGAIASLAMAYTGSF